MGLAVPVHRGSIVPTLLLLTFAVVWMPSASGTIEVLTEFVLPGMRPASSVIRGSDGALYGTTSAGGSHNLGTVFRIAADGTFNSLHDFNGSDGGNPYVALTLGGDGALYGTTPEVSSCDAGICTVQSNGTVFRIAADGTFSSLHGFNGSDGSSPQATLTLGRDGALYGTTNRGGANDAGTVFRIAADGTFSSLHGFNGSDGASPYGALTLGSEGALYGTTSGGGNNNAGTVFKLAANGAFTSLHSFNGSDGSSPQVALTLGSDGALYGTTERGGINDSGTVFKIAADGTFRSLHDFNDSDGKPSAALTLGTDEALYGTTTGVFHCFPLAGCVLQGNGTVFKVTTDGTFSTLHCFNRSDGASPSALTLGPEGALYGTTSGGGNDSDGTVFSVATDGTFSSLHSFNGNDGTVPQAALTLGSDGALYGTTSGGGIGGGVGTVFSILANGMFTSLHSFNSSDGWSPQAMLTRGCDGTLYGTTNRGGANDSGTVFKLAADGTFSSLHSFNGSDGAPPREALTRGCEGALYGTTIQGGINGFGTIYKFTAEGTFSTLHSFNGSDGKFPIAALTLGPDRALYGITSSDVSCPSYGGCTIISYGTVFKIALDGTFRSLHAFNGTDGDSSSAALTLGRDGALYGTTTGGGTSNAGTVFKITADGTFRSLHDFNDIDGRAPQAALTLGRDGALYGTTSAGGTSNAGTVFQIAADGTFRSLYSFNYSDSPSPQAALTLGSDGALYGFSASLAGFSHFAGTVFRIAADGTFNLLHSFNGSDGRSPRGALTLGPDGALYGVTSEGGTDGVGTVFKLAADGTFSSLHSFNRNDGSSPQTPLTLGPDGALYGTTPEGGTQGGGVIFRLATEPLPVNSPPNAAPDAFVFGRNGTTPVTFPAPGVLCNDTGTSTATLRIAGATATSPRIIVLPQNGGKVALYEDGHFAYWPPSTSFHGSRTFVYRVTDGKATSNTATVTLTVNRGPHAANDVATTSQGQGVPINLLDNDTAYGAATINPATVSIDTTPANGTVTVKANGSVVYTPNSAFGGSDSFTYTVKDSFDTVSNVATVTVYVPMAVSDSYLKTANTLARQTVTVSAINGVKANDVPNVKGRTFALVSGPVQTAGSGLGTLTLGTLNPRNGAFRYILKGVGATGEARQASKRGTWQFTYKMTLNGVATAPATVTITVQ